MLLFLLVLTSLVSSLSFTSKVDVTPNYPGFKDDISCSWAGSGDVTSTTLYWYRNGVLYDTISSATSPQVISWKTHSSGQTWNCSVVLSDGSSSINDWDLVLIGSTNSAPVINSAEFNDASDSGDENITINYVGTHAVRCFGTVTDANGNYDLESVSAVLYHSSSSVGDVDDQSDHYTIPFCSFNYSGDYTCNTYMTPSALAGTWTCQVTAVDQGAASGTKTDTVIVYKISPPDNPPNITSVEFNDVGDSGDENITLPESGTYPVRCFGYANDVDGNSAITSINATFYHQSSSYSASDNPTYHYSNSSCSYTTSTGYYECMATFEYYAANETWYCNVTAKDNTSLTDSAIDSVVIYKPVIPPIIPYFSSLEFNDVGDSGDESITLTSIQTKPVRCFGYVVDNEGPIHIDSLNATFYHSSSSSSSSNNNYVHYTNSSCYYSSSTGEFGCETYLWFYATPGTWYCNVTVIDNDLNINSSTDSVVVSAGPPADVSFLANPFITPQYPSRTENLVCSWTESLDVENRTVYWYKNGALDRTEYPIASTSTVLSADTKNGETWNCTVLLAGANLTATASDLVVIGSSPPNAIPVISSVQLNEVGDSGDESLLLQAGTTQPMRCFGTVTDADGNSDINTVRAVFYSSLVLDVSPDAPRNHYSNSSCSYDTGTGAYECSVPIYFYANPGTWSCKVYVNDSVSNLAFSSDSATMGTLLAMDIPDGTNIDFGGMVVNEQKISPSLNISIFNIGNVLFDVDVDTWLTGGDSSSANSLNCTVNNIPTSNFKSSFTYGSYSSYTSMLISGYYRYDANLDRQISGSTPTHKTLYLGLQTPSDVQGICSGVISVLGVAS